MSKPKEKHIERLLKGQKSGINIGSRAVPHHLRAHEKVVFDQAIRNRFLCLKARDRVNLENLWEKYCEAKNWPLVVLRNQETDKAEVAIDHQACFLGALQDAKVFAKRWVRNHHQL